VSWRKLKKRKRTDRLLGRGKEAMIEPSISLLEKYDSGANHASIWGI
jgi:hypothetical protein